MTSLPSSLFMPAVHLADSWPLLGESRHMVGFKYPQAPAPAPTHPLHNDAKPVLFCKGLLEPRFAGYTNGTTPY